MATIDDVRVIDADSHFTEPPDLWTAHAPAGWEDRVLHIEQVDGQPTWVVDGNVLGFARGGGVVARDESKIPFLDSMEKDIDWVHQGAWDPKARLEVMDRSGIHAQVLFPNAVGLGGQSLNHVLPDEGLRRLNLEIYNDAMAAIQQDSGRRFLPMAVMPAWDVDACVRETQRVAELGVRGINMTSDPQDLGSPDLANRAWDPLWELCQDLKMPVHFHIGSSDTAMDFFGKYFWESHDEYVKPAIGGSMLFLNSARVVINTIFAGIFDRYPELQMVAVESGIGWVPFILETMDYELYENAPAHFAQLSKKPSEYFASNWHATFWFERNQGDIQELVDKVGDRNIMFETDFPHPTCLYPTPLEAIGDTLERLRPESRRRILGENAAGLYRLDEA